MYKLVGGALLALSVVSAYGGGEHDPEPQLKPLAVLEALIGFRTALLGDSTLIDQCSAHVFIKSKAVRESLPSRLQRYVDQRENCESGRTKYPRVVLGDLKIEGDTFRVYTRYYSADGSHAEEYLGVVTRDAPAILELRKYDFSQSHLFGIDQLLRKDSVR